MNTVRINILILAAIGAVLVAGLAVFTSGEAQLSTLAIGASLVGGLAGTMTRLSEPEPDPAVPASIAEKILLWAGASDGAGIVDAAPAPPSPWRPNVLILALMGAVIVMALVFVLPGEAALVTVAGAFIGGVVSIASKLTDPPPNPSVPASVVASLLEHMPGTTATGPGTHTQDRLTA